MDARKRLTTPPGARAAAQHRIEERTRYLQWVKANRIPVGIPAEIAYPTEDLPSGLPDPDFQEITDRAEINLFWESCFKQHEQSLLDLHPLRVRIAWRFIRELLRVLGHRAHTPLVDFHPDDTYRDPWTDLRPFRQYRAHTLLATPLCNLLRDATELSTESNGGAISLLPPKPPHPRPPGYDPSRYAHDPHLHTYIDSLREVVGYLDIASGSPADRLQGEMGLIAMLSPQTIRMVFPSRAQIMKFEESLIQETLDILLARGPYQTRKRLFDTYGLTGDESQLLVQLARARALEITQSTLEEQRGIMSLQADEELHRAREAGDLKSIANILKHKAIVVGISRIEPDSLLSEFGKVVDSFAVPYMAPTRHLPPPAPEKE